MSPTMAWTGSPGISCSRQKIATTTPIRSSRACAKCPAVCRSINFPASSPRVQCLIGSCARQLRTHSWTLSDGYAELATACNGMNSIARGGTDVVRKVIDLECLLPPDEQGRPRQYHEQASHRIGYGDPELLEPRPGYGFANYKNIFRKRVDGASKSGPGKKAAGHPSKTSVPQLDVRGAEMP